VSAPARGSIQQTREAIDAVDRALLRLLAKRARLVRRAFRDKASRGEPLVDRERETAMTGARRAWGTALGLDPDRVDALFRAVLLVTRPPT